MLTQSEKDIILFDFPNIKLSYENITHKKVYNSDIILAVPEGKKCFAWFTEHNDANVCMIMELSESKTQVINISIVNACFSSDLVYGTILYGTVFYTSNNRFFSIEDVFYYKGDDISRTNWLDKLALISRILKNDLKQISYNNSFIVFGVPVLSNNYEDLISKIHSLKYKISTIQFYMFNRVSNLLYMPYKNVNININISNKTQIEPIQNICKPISSINPEIIYEPKPIYEPNPVKEINKIVPVKNSYKMKEKREIVFQIKPDIQNDVYHLYLQNNKGTLIFYDVANIPDYKTSVMMNKLFRNIKENISLDALEESDDEEEFENENLDRFVSLDKIYNMVCAYNYKFKKWNPLKIANANAKISSLIDL